MKFGVSSSQRKRLKFPIQTQTQKPMLGLIHGQFLSGTGVTSSCLIRKLLKNSTGMRREYSSTIKTQTHLSGVFQSLGLLTLGGMCRLVLRKYSRKMPLMCCTILKSKIPEGGLPLSIILYADKTQLSSFGTAKAYPVMARCGNLPVELRNGKGFAGGRLVGWLPIVSVKFTE